MATDRPDYTQKADVVIIEQVKDLKLIYDETHPLAINIARMVAEKLTVVAPSLQAVSVGETKTYEYVFASSVLSPGGSYKVLEVSGRGKVYEIVMQVVAMSSDSPFKYGDISWRLWIDESEPTWWSYLRSHEEYRGGVFPAYIEGKAAGTYFPPTTPDRPINIYVVRTTATAPGYDPWTTSIEDLQIWYLGWRLSLISEFETNFGLRVRHAGLSSNSMVYRGVVRYGLYP
jgi:hypothetical protein